MKSDISNFYDFVVSQGVELPEKKSFLSRFYDLFPPPDSKLMQILKSVCESLEMDISLISKKTRKRVVVENRQLAMWMMCEYSKESLGNIGFFFCDVGGHHFDHATVLHARKTVNSLRETNKVFLAKFEKVKDAVELSLTTKKEKMTDQKIDNSTELFKQKQAEMSDNELISLAKKQVSDLARSGGRSHKMCVPPMITDTDMLFSELIRRFEERTRPPESESNMKSLSDVADTALKSTLIDALYHDGWVDEKGDPLPVKNGFGAPKWVNKAYKLLGKFA